MMSSNDFSLYLFLMLKHKIQSFIDPYRLLPINSYQRFLFNLHLAGRVQLVIGINSLAIDFKAFKMFCKLILGFPLSIWFMYFDNC